MIKKILQFILVVGVSIPFFTFLILLFTPLNSLYSQTLQLNPDSIPFAPAVNYAVGGGHPHSVCAADLDGDGDKDLAVANADGDNVSILKNNGNGTFQPAVNYGAGNYPHFICASDFDGDSDIDLAVAAASSDCGYFLNCVYILKNHLLPGLPDILPFRQ